MLEFEKLRFDDAEISSVTLVGDELHVAYLNWREQESELVFRQVAGYQWFSPEGKALSHGTIEIEDPFLSLACDMADEDSVEGFKVFSFVSAWNDAKMLRIVAKEVASSGN
ncbi:MULTISPECIES: hypothetical protein [unclassified Dyella]|jgi:hypothetical protein|uniref:hypothetical protein n=1 Tax=unclassified Dyella TaxID=2634549 RepID=UPI003F92303A